MYSEETDLCLRARRKGWMVCMVDEVTVVHVGVGSASRKNLRQQNLKPGAGVKLTTVQEELLAKSGLSADDALKSAKDEHDQAATASK